MSGPSDKSPDIEIFTELDVPELMATEHIARWIANVVEKEGQSVERIIINLVDDDALYELNKQYLDHDTLTDILTFPYSYSPVNTELIISIDRIRDNAKTLGVNATDELNRVIIHGILHMCGWNDETVAQKKAMRRKEEECLELLTQAN